MTKYTLSKKSNVFYSTASYKVTKSNGHQAVYRAVKSASGKVTGYIWRGNMVPKAQTGKTIGYTTPKKTTPKKTTTKKTTTDLNKPITSGSVGSDNYNNKTTQLNQNVSNTNYNGFKNLNTLRLALNKLADIINVHPNAWDYTGWGTTHTTILNQVKGDYADSKAFYTDSSLRMTSNKGNKVLQKSINGTIKLIDGYINDAKY